MLEFKHSTTSVDKINRENYTSQELDESMGSVLTLLHALRQLCAFLSLNIMNCSLSVVCCAAAAAVVKTVCRSKTHSRFCAIFR